MCVGGIAVIVTHVCIEVRPLNSLKCPLPLPIAVLHLLLPPGVEDIAQDVARSQREEGIARNRACLEPIRLY